jgi:hypothetical protein
MEGASLDAWPLMSAKDIDAEDRWTLLPLSQEAQHIPVNANSDESEEKLVDTSRFSTRATLQFHFTVYFVGSFDNSALSPGLDRSDILKLLRAHSFKSESWLLLKDWLSPSIEDFLLILIISLTARRPPILSIEDT